MEAYMNQEAAPQSPRYTFSRYLASKRNVDDRSLNTQVRQALAEVLSGWCAETPMSILEIGAGTGAMLVRLLDWGFLPSAEYTAIDLQEAYIAEAGRCLPEEAACSGYTVMHQGDRDYLLTKSSREYQIHLEAADLFDFLRRNKNHRRWDLVTAHAFLDLVDIPMLLPPLFQLMRPNSLFYFTLIFDGETILEPAIDQQLDDQVIRLYHETMDRRLVAGRPSGDSRSGRHMFAYLHEAGAQILAAGSSDWVVYPENRAYPADEAYFLHFIVDTIRGALLGNPELNAEEFKRWIETRNRQIEDGRLVYIAHQMDFFGRSPHD